MSPTQIRTLAYDAGSGTAKHTKPSGKPPRNPCRVGYHVARDTCSRQSRRQYVCECWWSSTPPFLCRSSCDFARRRVQHGSWHLAARLQRDWTVRGGTHGMVGLGWHMHRKAPALPRAALQILLHRRGIHLDELGVVFHLDQSGLLRPGRRRWQHRLHVVSCTLHATSCTLHVACRMVCAGCCLVCAAWCAACCVVRGACCLVCAAWCVLHQTSIRPDQARSAHTAVTDGSIAGPTA